MHGYGYDDHDNRERIHDRRSTETVGDTVLYLYLWWFVHFSASIFLTLEGVQVEVEDLVR